MTEQQNVIWQIKNAIAVNDNSQISKICSELLSTSKQADISALILLSHYFETQENFVQSLKLLDLAIQQEPTSHLPLIARASVQKKIGNNLAALRDLHKALDLNPNSHIAHYNIANLYAALGKLKDAKLHYETSWALNKSHPEILYNLTRILRELGSPSQAAENLEKLNTLFPTYIPAYLDLADCLRTTAGLDAAVAFLRRNLSTATQISSAMVTKYLSLLLEKGDTITAKSYFQEIATGFSENAEIIYTGALIEEGLGNIAEAIHLAHQSRKIKDTESVNALIMKLLIRARDYTGAIEFGKEAQMRHSCSTDLLNNFAIAHQKLGKYQDAVNIFRSILKTDSSKSEIYFNFGNLLRMMGAQKLALASYFKCLELDPNNFEVLTNIAHIQREMGNLSDARTSLERALSLNSQSTRVNVALAQLKKDEGSVLEAFDCAKRAVMLDPENLAAYQNMLFIGNYHPRLTNEELRSLYEGFSLQFETPVCVMPPISRKKSAEQDKIIVGYVSGDFRKHSVSKFFLPLLRFHDRKKFFVICFSTNRKYDEITREIASQCDMWINIAELSDDEAAQKVRSLSVDILIDLSGHTADNRLLLFARRPAIAHFSCIGFGHTTGLKGMDYYIGSDLTLPPGSEGWFSERLCRLPIGFPMSKPTNAPEVGPPPSLKSGILTFGSLSRVERINDEVIKVWAKILNLLPNSRIILDQRPFSDNKVSSLFMNRFRDQGLDPGRVICQYTREHWNAYAEIDIALDPWPHNAGTTTYEALWMGVPVVSLKSRPPVGLLGHAILSMFSLDSLVCDDLDEYVETAVSLAADSCALLTFRSGMRERMLSSAGVDEKIFVQNFEKILMEGLNERRIELGL